MRTSVRLTAAMAIAVLPLAGCGDSGPSPDELRADARDHCAELERMLDGNLTDFDVSANAPVRVSSEQPYLRQECADALDELDIIDARVLGQARAEQANPDLPCSHDCDALDQLRAEVSAAGLTCTNWVRWDRSGSMRVLDSDESGSCRDQEITLATYASAADLVDALKWRAGYANWVHGDNWVAMFSNGRDARAFAEHTGGALHS